MIKRKNPNFIIAPFFLMAVFSCNDRHQDVPSTDPSLPKLTMEVMENEAWQMEERYWEYVKTIDTTAYKELWHEAFIGYPSFGDGVSDKRKIAVWIPELHKDSSLTFNYQLHKKAVNMIDDVVLVFYDVDEIWTDKADKIVRKDTYKLTHTWKKYADTWLILGGMAAKKDQDQLTD